MIPRICPAAPTFAEGWRIPKPDLVLTVPKPFKVKATGTIDYQFFVIDPGFTEDKWIQAAEVKPSCRAVVHHVLVFVQPPSEPLVLTPGCLRPPGQAKGVRGSGPGGGGPRPARRGVVRAAAVRRWTAGGGPGRQWRRRLHQQVAHRDRARRPTDVASGGNGQTRSRGLSAGAANPLHGDRAPQEDQCSIGLVFADPKTVRKEVVTDMVVNPRFEIPPGDPDFKVEAERVLEQDEEVLVWMPHTHVRGSGFKYEAIYPDGKKEVLLNVPQL